MTDAAISARPADATDRSRLEMASFHLALVALLIGSQLALAMTRELSADNTWLFRLARDLVAGRPEYWAAADPNRLFPDLLFGMIAAVLTPGRTYAAWLPAYHAIYALAVYGALLALAPTLFAERPQRRAFLLWAVLLLSALAALLPFWGGWLLVPGGEGGALPVGLVCLAALLAMNRAGRDSLAGLLATTLAAAALVASNPVLTVTFLAPLGLALAATAAMRRLGGGSGRAPLAPLIAATLAAALGGHAGWLTLSRLDRHRLVAPESMADIVPSAAWLAQRLQREGAELAGSLAQTWDILFGIALLAAAVVAAALVVARRLGRGTPTAVCENRLLLGLFAALSAFAALAFVVFANDDRGVWHYRALAVPLAFAAVFVSALPPRWRGFASRRRIEALTAIVASLALALTVFLARDRQIAATHTEMAFTHSIDDLARSIARHAEGRPLRGYADYWLSNDIDARSDVLQIGMLDSTRPEFRFYGNNAAALCEDGYFFVLHEPGKDDPKSAGLLAALGAPIRIERMTLARDKPVEVFYYDPETLAARITRPGREAAARLFPEFRCQP